MSGLFGLDTERSRSNIVILPVPWEVTTSYGAGTSNGPKAILQASPQLDLFDSELGNISEVGIHLEPESADLRQMNDDLKGGDPEKVNPASQKMVDFVYEESRKTLADGKIPAVLGGDHSTPQGLIQALSEKYEGNFGILHIDAHADLREAYQGYTHSHASIMRNVVELPKAPVKLVQVGIRDFCEEEYRVINERSQQIDTHFDREIKRQLFQGNSWDRVCDEMIKSLPENVYVSFDIDGLSPEFCPNTGTPVPGGLSFDQAVHLLSVLGRSQRKIIGFDLNEVAPGDNSEWDGNVGARILYKLCGWAAKSHRGQ